MLKMGIMDLSKINPGLISHSRVRLAIISILSKSDSCSFTDIASRVKATACFFTNASGAKVASLAHKCPVQHIQTKGERTTSGSARKVLPGTFFITGPTCSKIY